MILSQCVVDTPIIAAEQSALGSNCEEYFFMSNINFYSCFQQDNQIRAKIVVFLAVQMRIMWKLGKNSILALQMAIYRARIEFLPSYHIMYKNKNNIHDRFVSAQPHSLQLSGGKNDLFSPSPLRGSGRKCYFCLPQAEVNSVVPRQNGRECYILMQKYTPCLTGVSRGLRSA